MTIAAEPPRFHVLAVDDSSTDRKLIERLLKTSSYQVTAVDSVSKALQYLGLLEDGNNATPPDGKEVDVNLIITDYCMPEMTGYDLLKKIKESSLLKDIPVVIMSSENVPSRINRCLEGGAEEFFLKPVQLSDMKKLRPHILKSKSMEDNDSISNPSSSSSKRKSSSIGILPEGTKMAELPAQPPKRRHRTRTVHTEPVYGPPPPEVHPSIRSLRSTHRAAHPDSGTILEAASHLLMTREWPINCPRFMEGLQLSGMNCVSQLQYIRLDHHLLTALVERWSPQTNSFHLPVGEMTVTLQDVGMILGVQIDGPPLVGHTVVGVGKRWQSWPDCCDDLLGRHPLEGVVYSDPRNPSIRSSFRMGQARSQTCMPLRWLRWTFYRDSYLDLNDIEFQRHIRAYILFLLGCFLLPDTSGSEIHLQYLPLLEDLEVFSTYSLGSAVLGLLYRELCEATRPRRVNIAGCLHLLQVWSWEHLHVGRPALNIPYPIQIEGLSIGFRWNENFVRQIPSGTVKQYRDELDGLLHSQVIWMPYIDDILANIAPICLAGSEIWLCRVPLISWTRVEWHLPDRVLRQFGLLPRIDMPPMEPNFKRTDGRGKVGVDFADFHYYYISLWENRRSYIVHGGDPEMDASQIVTEYMHWYRSWATLFLLAAPTEAPTSYYPRAPTERAFRDHFLDVEELFQPFFGVRGVHAQEIESAINRCEELCSDMRRRMYIADTRYRDSPEEPEDVVPDDAQGIIDDTDVAGPSSYPDTGPHWDGTQVDVSGIASMPHSQGHPPMPSPAYLFGGMPYGSPGMMPGTSYYPGYSWMPSSSHSEPQQSLEPLPPHQLRDRPLRPPQHYTPGSGAIPRKGRGRKK